MSVRTMQFEFDGTADYLHVFIYFFNFPNFLSIQYFLIFIMLFYIYVSIVLEICSPIEKMIYV